MNNLHEASVQWARRPADERFKSLAELHQAVKQRDDTSRDVEDVPVAELIVVPQGEKLGLASDLRELQPALFTHWSMGQFCQKVRAPRDFLATISPQLAADVLNDRLTRSNPPPSRVLFGSNGVRVVRAFHGSQYSRLWDSEVTQSIIDNLPKGWRNPVAYGGGKFGNELEPSGLYASDRDMFAFLISGGDFKDQDWSTVDLGGDVLHRGFYVWNSEVGNKTFGWASFWFRVVCGNHIIWGAEDVNVVSAVHRSSVRLTFESGFKTFMRELTTSDTRDRFAAAVKAGKSEIAVALKAGDAETMQEAGPRFRGLGFSEFETERALKAIREEETGATGTRWDWLQGFTASARSMAHVEAREALERRASEVLLK